MECFCKFNKLSASEGNGDQLLQILLTAAEALKSDPSCFCYIVGKAEGFFQTVQNKMLFAVTGHTAPELIFNWLDATKEKLGLTNYKGSYPRKSDLKASKNYLGETELKRLNLIVSGYLDTAEYQVEMQSAMTMVD